MNDFQLKVLSASFSELGVLSILDKDKLLNIHNESELNLLIILSHRDTLFLKLYTPSFQVLNEADSSFEVLKQDIAAYIVKTKSLLDQLLYQNQITDKENEIIDSLTFRLSYLISEALEQCKVFNIPKYPFEGTSKINTFSNVRKIVVEKSEQNMPLIDIYNDIFFVDSDNYFTQLLSDFCKINNTPLIETNNE